MATTQVNLVASLDCLVLEVPAKITASTHVETKVTVCIWNGELCDMATTQVNLVASLD
jgi:hypothetical protein